MNGDGYFSRSFGNWLPDDPQDPETFTDDEKLATYHYDTCADCGRVVHDDALEMCADDEKRCDGCAEEFRRENSYLAVKVL